MTTPIEEDPLRDLRVRLHPFLHQVSGSSVMFKFDGNTVCKPLLPKEYNFYKFLPESLREFTAEYKGITQSHGMLCHCCELKVRAINL